MTLALLDADIIAFRAAVTAQDSIDWGDGEGASVVADLSTALDNARQLIREWTSAAGCRTPVLCFSSRIGLNFRKALLPTYKSGRSEKPQVYWDLIDALEQEYRFYRIEGLEADDVLGILATSDRFSGSVVVSLDKDLQTVPCRLLNPNKDQRPRPIRMAQADLFWMTQTLTGDQTDGYPGCPKIGPVNADKILGAAGLSLNSMWSAVVEAYEARGLTEDDALLQARMARILRRSDYDKERNEIALWHPTTPTILSLDRLITSATGQSSLSTSSSPTACASDKGTSSNTSPGSSTKGRRSKTSRRPAGTSTA